MSVGRIPVLDPWVCGNSADGCNRKYFRLRVTRQRRINRGVGARRGRVPARVGTGVGVEKRRIGPNGVGGRFVRRDRRGMSGRKAPIISYLAIRGGRDARGRETGALELVR